MRIAAAKQAVQDLPITPSVLATLRETARLFSTHYSTMIEGNRLTLSAKNCHARSAPVTRIMNLPPSTRITMATDARRGFSPRLFCI